MDVYGLLKNPYLEPHQLVTLDVVPYTGAMAQADEKLPRLTLNRMMSPNLALFDVRGLDVESLANGTGRWPVFKIVGQLAVEVDSAKSDLLVDRPWQVELLGVLDGTNGFGAPVQVPHVRFYEYSNKSRSELNAAEINRDSGNAAPRTFEQDNVPRPIVSVLDLLKNPYRNKGESVVLDVRGSREEALGVYFNKMISQDVALFDVEQAWQLLGQIAVVEESPGAKISMCQAWVVEVMGVTGGTNGFGAPIQIPLVRFRGYSAQLPQVRDWYCGE